MHMKRWVRSLVICLAGSVTAAVSCGKPEIIREEDHAQHFKHDASVPSDGGPPMKISIGDGGNAGCPSTCEELNANCGFVTDTKCGGVIQCGAACPAGESCGGGGPSRCGTGTSSHLDAGSC